MDPRRPYRQEGPGTEALSRGDPDAHDPAAERDPRPTRAGRASAPRRRPPRRASRGAGRGPRVPTPIRPPSQRASETPLACQRHQVLGPERGRETVASGGQAARSAGADRRPGSEPGRAPPRSSAEGCGRRGRAVAARRAHAGRARTPVPPCRGTPAGARGTEPSRPRSHRARRAACAPARRSGRSARAPRRSATAPRWHRPPRAPARRARRRGRAGAARTGRA